MGAIFSHAIWREHFATPDLPPAEMVIRHYVDLVLASVGFTPRTAAKAQRHA